ncbi:uncharacterized protein LOC113295551 [Papaver somniferum]|uniref:uncharacterized protein LOC113295551 n=1 Tax=Papaver somniferum TaxID=3469 RepID=UPI000E6F81F5|nr:uncharacterized protein LOC113295551 [Papaver somniferum]
MIFYREPKGFCCSDGKVVLPFVPPPVELLEMYEDQLEVGEHFRRKLADNREGVYTFRVQGDIYHKIGSLLPPVVENETDPPITVRPRYIQMYIYDIDNDIDWRMEEDGADLNREVMEKLRIILDTHNRFVHVIRPLAQREDIQRCRLVIKEQPATEKQYTLPTSSQVATIVVEGDGSAKPGERDIVVRTIEGKLLFIQETSGCYDPLQYPLLFPYRSYGWNQNSMDENGRQFTCLEYYSYMLQIRSNDASLLLRGGRLLQQYAVDNWVRIDLSRLRWLSNHQEEIRAEFHQGIQDARTAGETSAKNFGQRKVLPSSYMGSPRYTYQRYQDAMALVQKYGNPDLFITMTCNPLWDEIVSNLGPGQSASDRPDLTTRVFRAKLEELKEDLFTKSIFGRVAAHVHVFEFQKRGLPHVYMLIIFRDEDKLQGPDDYDKIVRAKIPNPEEEPELHECVKKWMIHSPCGSKCTRDEICSSVESVKYLYKYVYKGPDYVSFGVQPVDHDEITRYINAIWVCSQEALLKIFRFPLYKVYPSVVRLQIHLPNQQSVRYYDYQMLDEILSDERNLRTTLTEFFVTNARDPRARELLYREFIKCYCWDTKTKEWRRRRSTQKAIRRVYTVPSCAGERAAEKLGLLENDRSARASLAEAATVKMPSALRRQFFSILHFCNPTGVRELWDEFFNNMVDDYSSSSNTSSTLLSDRLLRELNLILKQHDKDISMYDLPPIVGTLGKEVEILSLIQEELSIPISDEDLSSVQKLNEDQSRAYNTIMGAIERKETTATSGIAATTLPGGRTSHSRFHLPMTPTSTSTCRTKKQTEEAELLRHSTVLMWDEAMMAHRYSLEAFDRMMRDIIGIAEPFGGKILIMGGDFRQVLPVIPRSTRGQTVDACLSRSHFVGNVHVLRLKKNMGAVEDASYSEFLICVGDGDNLALLMR